MCAVRRFVQKCSLYCELRSSSEHARRFVHAHYMTSYPTSHFNSLAMLLKLAQTDSIDHRNIIMSQDNSILMALENHANHDWRIIKLREALFDKGWRIYKVDKAIQKTINEHLSNIYKTLATRNVPATEDFETWQALMEEAVGANGKQRTPVSPSSGQSASLTWETMPNATK